MCVRFPVFLRRVFPLFPPCPSWRVETGRERRCGRCAASGRFGVRVAHKETPGNAPCISGGFGVVVPAGEDQFLCSSIFRTTGLLIR